MYKLWYKYYVVLVVLCLSRFYKCAIPHPCSNHISLFLISVRACEMRVSLCAFVVVCVCTVRMCDDGGSVHVQWHERRWMQLMILKILLRIVNCVCARVCVCLRETTRVCLDVCVCVTVCTLLLVFGWNTSTLLITRTLSTTSESISISRGLSMSRICVLTDGYMCTSLSFSFGTATANECMHPNLSVFASNVLELLVVYALRGAWKTISFGECHLHLYHNQRP